MSTKHDALSRSIETLNTNGCLIVREYNLVSDLTALYSKDGSEQKWTTRISKIEYESDGLPMKIYYGNGARKTYRYDVNTRKPLRICISSSSKDLSEDIVHYYDCRGNLTHQMNSAQDVIFYRNSKIDPSRDYTYDSLGRLIKALGREQIDVKNGTARSARPHGKGSSNLTTSFTPTDAKSVCAYQETYKYDDAGNILDLQHEALDKSIAGWTRTYNYKARSLLNQAQTSNKLTSTAIGSIEEHFSYDDIAGKMGCMTAMSGYSSISWDYGGRLRSSSTQVQKKGVPEMTWYIYDYQGQRVRKVTDAASSVASSASKSKDILYLPQAELQRTYSASQKRARKEIQTSKITGAKDAVVVLLETIETDDALVQLTRYQIGEHLELDANGLLISYEEYSPFGTSTFCAVRSNVSAPSKYRWGAYERDAESGMMHCGARYYAPWLGRWISCDPAGTADGDNLYCYVGNDPVNYHDPSGLVKAEKLGSNRVDTSANNTSAPGRSKGCFQKFCECLSGAFSFGRAGRPLLGANATAMERNSELQQFNQTVPHGITGIAGQSNMSEYNAGQAADLTMNANVRRTNQSIHPRQFPNVLRYAELVEDKGVQSQRGEGVQSQRGEGVQSQRGEGVQSQRGEGVQVQRAEVVQSEPAESWGSIVQVSYTDESDLIEMLGLLNAGENRVGQQGAEGTGGQQGAEKIGGQWEGAKTEPNASLVLEDLDGPNEAVRKTKSLTLR